MSGVRAGGKREEARVAASAAVSRATGRTGFGRGGATEDSDGKWERRPLTTRPAGKVASRHGLAPRLGPHKWLYNRPDGINFDCPVVIIFRSLN